MIIICYIASLISQIAFIYMYGKMVHQKANLNKRKVIVMMAASAIQLLLNELGWKVIVASGSIIYFYIMFSKLYESNKKEIQNYSIIIWIISIMLDVIMMMLMNKLGVPTMKAENIQKYKAISSISMSIILIVLSNIKIVTRFANKLHQKINRLEISPYQMLLITIVYFIIGLLSSRNMDSEMIMTAILLLGVSLIITIIIYIYLQYQIITLKITNEILEKNNESNIKVINQYRMLKHNLESQLMGIKAEANKKAKKLIEELIKENNESFYIKQDIREIPAGINGIVYEKLYKYRKEKMKITIENKIKGNILKEVGARSYNIFCEALGVTLDNALESSKESKEKVVYIEFKEEQDKIKMKIMNTFKGEIEIDKLGTIYYTSKEKGHGLGLYSLIGRKNLKITTSIKNDLFINDIEVKKLKN